MVDKINWVARTNITKFTTTRGNSKTAQEKSSFSIKFPTVNAAKLNKNPKKVAPITE